MITTLSVLPGVTLRCVRDTRFKQGCLSIQFLRTMCREEAAFNALIPAVLLRGCEGAPDLRAITLRLDDLYGASVGALVRRVGDLQITGFYCSFIEDAYALEGDKILEPMLQFVRRLLLSPVLENGVFVADYVESEKKNLIAAIESQRNDKRVYAGNQLMAKMCAKDSYGIPRLGEADWVREITAENAYAHYGRILAESPVELFYVGQAEPEAVRDLVKPLFADLCRTPVSLPVQTGFTSCGGGEFTETMDVSQGKLAMGFVTPITFRDSRFAAMQVCNTIFGGGMTSKLFVNIREKGSLCYDIGSGFRGSKGIVTVQAGIDCDKEPLVRRQILEQLEALCRGQITQAELTAAKAYLVSSLDGVQDSPGAIENYYFTGALSGLGMTAREHKEAVQQVTAQQVAQAAKTVKLDTVYFLKGVQ